VSPVYLDYNATTPVDNRVLEAMLPYFSIQFGNPASKTHPYGWAADEAVTIAREQTAALIGTTADQIVFTSGATEALNLAILGVAEAYAGKGKQIVTLATEHKAVLDTLSYLERKGFEIIRIQVDRNGQPDIHDIRKAVTSNTILVAAMLANNETGVIMPVQEIAEVTHAAGSIFLCDATQACGKIQVDVDKLGIDLLALSAHKLYGPKGSGALFVRRKNPRVSIIPQLHGGGHEAGRRSGTLNVPGIVGLGKAAEIALNESKEDSLRIQALKNRLEEALIKNHHAIITAEFANKLCNTVHFRIPGIKADRLISALPDLAFSTGSACSSALPEPSPVLKAMGFSEKEAYEAIRISLGKFTTIEDVEVVISRFYSGVRGGYEL
jgi:cysteine desulfurase